MMKERKNAQRMEIKTRVKRKRYMRTITEKKCWG